MKILANILHRLLLSYPTVPPENGGILGGTQNIITEYYHDNSIQKDIIAEYSPNTFHLNIKIQDWHKKGIEFYGLIHSHPSFEKTLSLADIDYIMNIMNSIPFNECFLYFPIVIPHETIIPYIAHKKDSDIKISNDILQII